MKTRLNDRILARNLRKKGYSFSEIISKIPDLSKGTLNGWLKDIELSEEQKNRLLKKIVIGGENGRLKGSFRNHQKRIELTARIQNMAKEEAKRRIMDPFFIAGIMLYWAEGDKTQERVGFTNSDPQMIQFMMKWFREICNVQEDKFRVALSLMTLHDIKKSEKFWSTITGVSMSKFNKTRIKKTLLKGKRNPSYMGTCRVVISDKNLFRRIAGWRIGHLEELNFLPS